jgi:C4-dicarboxylate transporter DctM subunit
MITGFAGFAILLALLMFRIPIAFAMAAVGFVGFGFVVGWSPALAMIGQVCTDTVFSYTLSVLPLFILMGNFITQSKLSEQLFSASNAFIGHWRGGLALASIMACAGFASVCGSSMATAATMCRVAMPSMRQYGYSDRLSTASIAAGGTLGILIPPSTIMVLYGIMTNTDIGKLFAAGIIPGIFAASLYMATVAVVTRVDPTAGPPGPRAPWAERWRALRGVWGIIFLFGLVMGGIYTGAFTPTEAAGIGASGAFFFALFRRQLSWSGIVKVLVETGRTTAVMFILLIGALIFSNFLNVSGAPGQIASWINGLSVPPFVIIFAIIGIYVILGCFLESISMMLLTVPLFYPIVQTLGYDLIWFGIIVVVVVEISLITPPVGLNVFIMNSLLPDVPTEQIFKGVLPFVMTDLVRIAILVFFPAISLFLPRLMN